MADGKEWYKVPSMGEIGDGFPNLEAASAAAEQQAAHSDKPVVVVRCTETVVRRYRRQVTVVPEDVSAFDA